MPRTRAYNEDLARQGLMMTFYQFGFANTSLADMENGSGLNRRQLYNDFGDKKEVFIQALKDFMDLSAKEILSDLEHSPDGIASIERVFNHFIAHTKEENGRLGCLVCNTSRETIADDPEVATLISQFFRRVEQAHRSALKRAVEKGEISEKENLRSLARFLLGVHISLLVMIKAGESVAVLKDVAGESILRLRS